MLKYTLALEYPIQLGFCEHVGRHFLKSVTYLGKQPSVLSLYMMTYISRLKVKDDPQPRYFAIRKKCNRKAKLPAKAKKMQLYSITSCQNQ